jgi:hypothetical protein
MDIELINIITTSFLSILLIISTIIISVKQYRLEKTLNKSQEELQIKIARKDIQVSLFQNRMNCYFQIIQALDIIGYYDRHSFLNMFHNNTLQYALEKLSKGRELLFKSLVESEALFNDEIMLYINDIYGKYNKFYSQYSEIITTLYDINNQSIIIKLYEIMNKVIPKNNKSNEDAPMSYLDLMNAGNDFVEKPEMRDFFKENFPKYEETDNILKELLSIYKLDNELFKLISPYIRLEANI